MNRKVFATSDIHFGHANIIDYCGRPFKSVEEMDAEIISRWNSVVGPGDETYVVGDFAMQKQAHHGEKLDRLRYLVAALNGAKHLVRGNHDYYSDEEYLDAGFASVTSGVLEINLAKHWWNMCHYQMCCWNASHRGSFHLFGHEHWRSQKEPRHSVYEEMGWSERKFNVCMDANGFKPVNLNDIVRVLEKRETNFRK